MQSDVDPSTPELTLYLPPGPVGSGVDGCSHTKQKEKRSRERAVEKLTPKLIVYNHKLDHCDSVLIVFVLKRWSQFDVAADKKYWSSCLLLFELKFQAFYPLIIAAGM